ncbi:MAG: bifunctional DNA primase/polymerase [bacterium]
MGNEEKIEEKTVEIQTLLKLGFPLIPISPRKKAPIGKFWSAWVHKGEAPGLDVWKGLLEEIPDLNIALALGRGLFALDVDFVDYGDLPEKWFQSVVIETPRPGLKVLYRTIQMDFPSYEFTFRKDGREYKLEVHGKGKYAILPPSFIDENGEKGFYKWLIPLLGPENALAEAPEDLLEHRPAQYTFKGDFLSKVQGAKAECIRVITANIKSGMRNKGLFYLGLLLKRDRWELEKVWEFIKSFGLALGLKNYELRSLEKSLGKDYRISCGRVKEVFPGLITASVCGNCLVAERGLETEMTKGKFLLRAGDLLKDDPFSFFVAFILAKYNLYEDPVFKISFVEKETGFSKPKVLEALKKLQSFGLIPERKQKEIRL